MCRNLLGRNRDNKLLRRNNGTSVIPGAIFPGIFTATLDTLLYHFHFIFRINYRVTLISPPFARQIARADKLPRSLAPTRDRVLPKIFSDLI